MEQSAIKQTPAVTMSAMTATASWKSLVQWRLICALPDVPTQWRSGINLMSIAVGVAGVISVKFCAAPAESHSRGSTGAPLAPVTLTTAAAPPSPGSTPGGAGARVSELPRVAVITSSPATLRVMPVLEPGIVIGASPSIGAVNEIGAERAWNGSTSGQLIQPSKLKVILPSSVYVAVEPPGVGVYLTETGRGELGLFRSY